VVLIDTDSAHLCLKELIDSIDLKFKNNNEFISFANELDKKVLSPYFNKILDEYANNFGVKNIINFKREKIISHKLILAKKKYADLVLDKEGLIYETPKLDITGFETVKTSTPKFCKKTLNECLRFIMESNDRHKAIKQIKEIYKDYLKEDINNIALPKKVNVYSKYAEPIETYLEKNSTFYNLRTPQSVKGAINYNFLVRKFDLPLQPIGNGGSCKLLFVNKHNILNTDVISYVGTYPDRFKKMFTVDYDKLWDISFLRIIQRIFDAIGWGTVNMMESTINEIIEF